MSSCAILSPLSLDISHPLGDVDTRVYSPPSLPPASPPSPQLSSPCPPFLAAPNTNSVQQPLYVISPAAALLQRQKWASLLPTVQPFYAVKAFPDREVIKILAAHDTNFDCASAAEIDLVLSLGVAPARIIFANPTKFPSHIRHAVDVGVRRMTADSAEEFAKIAAVAPGECGVLLRIAVTDTASKLPFSSKFGADLPEVEGILRLAAKLPVTIEGISFHVGSGGSTPETFRQAIMEGLNCLQLARSLGHNNARILDIGGGFVDSETTEEIAKSIRLALAEAGPSVEVIAEPGRWFATPCVAVLAQVVAVRFRRGRYAYTLSEGAYGMFSSTVWDKQEVTPILLRPASEHQAALTDLADFWGPTCDSLDYICKGVRGLPLLQVGEWILFRDMGSYTFVSATEFNGFGHGTAVYCDSLESLLPALSKGHPLAVVIEGLVRQT